MSENTSSKTPTVSRRGAIGAIAGTAVTALAGCISHQHSPSKKTNTVKSLPTPTLGASNAPVTVAGWYDYTCPHCSEWYTNVYPKLKQQYIDTGKIQFQHHDFPIPVTQLSWPVAEIARSVQDHAGTKPFFSFATAAHQKAGTLSRSQYVQLAVSNGVSKQTAQTAMMQQTYYPVIESDRKTLKNRGRESVPSMYVNGSIVSDPHNYPKLSSQIDTAMSKSN